MKTIDRYILKDLTKGFLVSFIIVSVVMLLGNLIKIYDVLFARGVGIGLLGKIMLDACIFLSIFTIPMALTLAVNFTYTQMSANFEITALRASGVSLRRIFLPALLFSSIVFVLLFIDVSFFAYRARLSYKTDIVSAFKKRIYVGLKAGVFYNGLKSSTLYAKRISPDKKHLFDVFFANKNSVITAKEAIFKDTPFGVVVDFINAHIYSSRPDLIEYGRLKNYSVSIRFQSQKKHYYKANDIRFMTIAELINYYKQTHSKGALYKINKMLVLSFSVFVLALIAFSFGITLVRSGKSTGAAISMSIFFAYYILEMTGESMFKNFSLIWPIWLPDVVLLLFGIYMFRRKSQV